MILKKQKQTFSKIFTKNYIVKELKYCKFKWKRNKNTS